MAAVQACGPSGRKGCSGVRRDDAGQIGSPGSIRGAALQTSLLIAFALVALLLAAIGIYGLMRYSIATRMREISIRIAVGAQRGDIFQMILREGLTLTFAGLAVGLAGALWLGQVLSGLVFGVTAADPFTVCRCVGAAHWGCGGRVLFSRSSRLAHRSSAALKYE